MTPGVSGVNDGCERERESLYSRSPVPIIQWCVFMGTGNTHSNDQSELRRR